MTKSKSIKNTILTSQSGYTLITTALVILVMGFVMTAIAGIYITQKRYERLEASDHRLNKTREALSHFASLNGRLPCPAPINAAQDSAEYGVSVGTATGCDTAATYSGIATTTGRDGMRVQIGAIPTRTLNLPDEIGIDGWSKRTYYAVTANYTDPAADFSKNNGAITLMDEHGQHVTSSPSNAIYLLLSAGEDSRGVYSLEGEMIEACEESSFAGENCDFNDATFHVSANRAFGIGSNSYTNTFFYTASVDIFKWNVTYGNCTCPTKTRAAIIQCLDSDNNVVGDENCLAQRPDETPKDCSGERDASGTLLVGNCFGWYTPPWGPCPCDTTISRTSTCNQRSGNNGSFILDGGVDLAATSSSNQNGCELVHMANRQLGTMQSDRLHCDREGDVEPQPNPETMYCGDCPPPPPPPPVEFTPPGGGGGGCDPNDPSCGGGCTFQENFSCVGKVGVATISCAETGRVLTRNETAGHPSCINEPDVACTEDYSFSCSGTTGIHTLKCQETGLLITSNQEPNHPTCASPTCTEAYSFACSGTTGVHTFTCQQTGAVLRESLEANHASCAPQCTEEYSFSCSGTTGIHTVICKETGEVRVRNEEPGHGSCRTYSWVPTTIDQGCAGNNGWRQTRTSYTCVDNNGGSAGAGFCGSKPADQIQQIRDTSCWESGDGGGGDSDPLILDLNGDGKVELSSREEGVQFDLDNDGIDDQTGWVDCNDGLLFIDENGDGIVTNQSELFGNEQMAAFEELALHDSNGDGVINSEDDNFGRLMVWQDVNQDGISQASEMTTLGTQSIAEITVKHEEVMEESGGNRIEGRGSFTRFLEGVGEVINETIEAFLKFFKGE